MNKNQNALDNIGSIYFSMNYVANEKLRLEFEKMYNEHKRTLQELIDRATPFKPNHIRVNSEERYGTCKCLSIVFENNNYCKYCGQALDWSNNED